MKKENVNELIYNYYQKDEYALKEIIEFYRPMVIKILQEKCDFQDNRTAIYKDVLSRADYLLVKCLEHFRYGYNGSFTSFYRRSLYNMVVNVVRSYSRERTISYKMLPIYHYVKEDSKYLDLNNAISQSNESVHEEVMLHLEVEEKLTDAKKVFTELDLKILELKQEGFSTAFIAEKLQMNVRSIRYRINKMKKYILSD